VDDQMNSLRSLQVTAIIPSYNGFRYIGQVLNALARQSLAPAEFEIVVVDNKSTVPLFETPEAIEALDILTSRGVAFRVVREERQGLTFARRAGVSAAAAETVVFLDDDNVVCEGYLQSGCEAMRAAEVGLLISRVSPVYEKFPSPAFHRRRHLLAINESHGVVGICWPPEEILCPSLGAGLWIRRQLFEDIQTEHGETLLPDRVGDRLISGGDIELGIHVGVRGYGRKYVPALIVEHHIPAVRLQPAYFYRLIDGIVRSTATIEARYLNRRQNGFSKYIKFSYRATFGVLAAALRSDPWREYRCILASARASFRGGYEEDADAIAIPTKKSP